MKQSTIVNGQQQAVSNEMRCLARIVLPCSRVDATDVGVLLLSHFVP
jgi:hypothetical protein